MAERKPKKERPSHWPKAHKDNADGSLTFKCVGGRMHGNIVRLYEPFDTITFPYDPPERYELMPPAKEGKAWVLVHATNPD